MKANEHWSSILQLNLTFTKECHLYYSHYFSCSHNRSFNGGGAYNVTTEARWWITTCIDGGGKYGIINGGHMVVGW
ncbi:conserved hypothetical protein [Ricinus communis]|uniref:Uncharacterized protein n=1 Tax=Ricinus communis TaxID=3988 RepID=B9SY21_RICCO|nr:conserved hypothetical protein [Ricinus communis]